MDKRFGWQVNHSSYAEFVWCSIAYNKPIKTRYTNHF